MVVTDEDRVGALNVLKTKEVDTNASRLFEVYLQHVSIGNEQQVIRKSKTEAMSGLNEPISCSVANTTT